MNKIALIAPVISVYEKAKEIVEREHIDNIKVYYESLEEGKELAKKLEYQGFKIIISRGGTYQMAKSILKIPVVEIKTTTFDIVEAIMNIRTENAKIAVVGYSRMIKDFKSIKKVMEKPFSIIEISSKEDMEYALQIAKKDGINVFIGDSTVVELSKKLNCEGILLSSTEESIQLAIDEALNISKLTSEISRRNQELLAMISNVHDGIIIINKELEVVNINKKAIEVIGGKIEDLVGRNVRSVIDSTKLHEVVESGTPSFGDIQILNEQKILTNRVPIFIDDEIIGAIATFQTLSEVVDNEVKVRKILHKKGFVAKYTFEKIIHESEIMKKCIKKAKVFSKYNAPVHIYGETGVGKELFSQSIHNESLRSKKPFIAVNCAALPRNLIESELFGYEDGAFTGASRKGKQGVFELAHNGTLFLDEIDQIPVDLQGRLLRAIQENEIVRVGGEEIVNVDVRLVTASNKNLIDLVESGQFREDLYYRIHVLSIEIPSLRDRYKDVILLSNYFLDKFSKKHNVERLILTEYIEENLMRYNFNGNVRELENLIEVSVLLGDFEELIKVLTRNNGGKKSSNIDFERNKTLEDMELEFIEYIYNRNKKNVELTSSELGISRTTLWRKLKKVDG